MFKKRKKELCKMQFDHRIDLNRSSKLILNCALYDKKHILTL